LDGLAAVVAPARLAQFRFWNAPPFFADGTPGIDVEIHFFFY